MGFVDRLKKGFSLLFNPSRDAKGNYSIGKSLKFYYSVAVLAAIFAAIVFTAAHFAGVPVASNPFLSGAFGASASIYIGLLFIALMLFVLVPIGMFIDAALYHLVGKFFLNTFKGAYEKTFAAVTAATAPIMLLFWLLYIPIVGMAFAVLIGIWELVLVVIALSVQHRTTRVNAVVVMLVTLVASLLIAWAFAALGMLVLYNSTLTTGGLLGPGMMGAV